MQDIRTVLGLATAGTLLLGAAGYVGTRAWDSSDELPTVSETYALMSESVRNAESVRLRLGGDEIEYAGTVDGSNHRYAPTTPDTRFPPVEVIAAEGKVYTRMNPESGGPFAVSEPGGTGQPPPIGEVLESFLTDPAIASLAEDDTRVDRRWTGEEAVYVLTLSEPQEAELSVSTDGTALPIALTIVDGETVVSFTDWDSVDPFSAPPTDQVSNPGPATDQPDPAG